MSDTPLKLDAAPLASAAGDDPWQAAASAAPADWLDDAADAVEAAAGAGPAAAHGAADALAGHAEAIEAAITGMGVPVSRRSAPPSVPSMGARTA